MRPYKLSEDLWLIETALFLPSSKTLIIADLQLGIEGELRRHGQNIRYRHGESMRTQLIALARHLHAQTIVVNGDLKHEFGTINAQERYDVLALLHDLKAIATIVIVRGNHDTITQPLAKEPGVAFENSYRIDDLLCIHGHKEPTDDQLKDIKTIVIGHMHPAITLTDGIRTERCKCFLVGSYKRKQLIVLPSTSTVTEGTDVLTATPNTPLLAASTLEKCNLYLISEEIRSFGTVKIVRNAFE